VFDLKLNKMALSLLRQNPAEMVVFGHSHIPFLGTDGKITLFNPGSAGPPRFRLPITMGLMGLSVHRVTFKHVDLQTGEEWKPR
jgi:predicted phosphodiesterase